MEKQEYLGDGVYAKWDGYQIELRANDPDSEDVIYIEPRVLDALVQFLERCTKEKE